MQNLSAEEISLASINFNLDLPEEYKLELQPGGLYKATSSLREDEIVGYTADGFYKILVIYTTYEALARAYPLMVESIRISNQMLLELGNKVDSLQLSVGEAYHALDTCEVNRKLVSSLLESEVKINDKNLRRQKIKSSLIISGTAVGSLAVGIILGLFIFR